MDSVEGCPCSILQPVELDAKQQSLTSCWLRCMYTAIVQHMPKQHIREVVFDHSSPCPAASPYAFLRGPVAYVLGLDSLWSSLRAWVTIACVNVSLYNGYHDWHVDGPSFNRATGVERGRYHKAFFMIAKEGAHDAYRTNLRVASNEFKVPGQYDTRGQPIWRSLPKAKPTWFSEDASNGNSWWDRLSNWRYWHRPWKLWGVRDDWDDIEQVAKSSIYRSRFRTQSKGKGRPSKRPMPRATGWLQRAHAARRSTHHQGGRVAPHTGHRAGSLPVQVGRATLAHRERYARGLGHWGCKVWDIRGKRYHSVVIRIRIPDPVCPTGVQLSFWWFPVGLVSLRSIGKVLRSWDIARYFSDIWGIRMRALERLSGSSSLGRHSSILLQLSGPCSLGLLYGVLQ